MPLVVVLGPTGSGKSELALALADAFAGELVNCDSIQVYKRLDIGSAKTPPDGRRGIPHHLIDIIDADGELSAGAYSRLARASIAAIQGAGKLPIVAGGTGFYVRALLDGLSPAPARNETLRERLAETGGRRPRALHRFLRRYDPQAAARIHPNDRQKLIRAIELTVLARKPASQVQSSPRDALQGVSTLKLGLAPERSHLYNRLNQRSAWMFAHGLLAETKAILEAGFSSDVKALQSLGYKQALGVLSGQLTVDEAVEQCQRKTRQYAKRQMTWFRRESGVIWLRGFGAEPAIQEQAKDLVRSFLNPDGRLPGFN